LGIPSKCMISVLSTDLARQWLQIDTDLLFVIASTADELSRVPTSMTLNDLEVQKWVLVIFLRFQAEMHIFKSEFSLKLLEIDPVNLRMKLN